MGSGPELDNCPKHFLPFLSGLVPCGESLSLSYPYSNSFPTLAASWPHGKGMGPGPEIDKRTVADGLAKQPGLNFPDKKSTIPQYQFGEGGCSFGVPAPTSELGRDGLGQMYAFTTGANEEQYMRT